MGSLARNLPLRPNAQNTLYSLPNHRTIGDHYRLLRTRPQFQLARYVVPSKKRGNSRLRMGHLSTIHATICDAVTITALCGPPLPQKNRKDGNFQLYRWYKNIGEFLYFGMFPSQRNCKADRLGALHCVPPQLAIHPMAVASYSAKITTGAYDLWHQLGEGH